MTWMKPYSGITHYTLRVESPGNRVIENVRLNSEETSYTIRDLLPGETT